MAGLVAVAGGLGLGLVAPAGAAEAASSSTAVTAPGGAPLKLKGTGVGFTVSWLPTTAPVQIVPGQKSTGSFYVTNQTTEAIPVSILPGTAVPGRNGTLQVRPGADARFPAIVYAPNTFVSQPKTTTTVSVTVSTPSDLAPGVYIVPAIVRPNPPKGPGNIQILQEIDALVTFQVPGAVNANLQPTFISSARSHHVPGLPTVQMSTSGTEVLRVVNNSPSALYSYNEMTATQTPFGTVVFKGHTVGDPHDLRNDIALYFPRLSRDNPVVWHPSSVGVGTGHITAYVSFHPNPGEIAQRSTSVSVLVISPLWILGPTVVLALLVLLALRRSRREADAEPDTEPVHRGLASRTGQVVGSLILVFIAVVGAFLSSPVVFAVVAAVGAVLAALIAVDGRGRSQAAVGRRTGAYEAVAGLLLVAGAVVTVVSVLSTWSPDIAVGLVAGAAVWTLFSWWVHWWNEERHGPSAPAQPGSGIPGAQGDMVSSST